jgi:hypothetical protein
MPARLKAFMGDLGESGGKPYASPRWFWSAPVGLEVEAHS